MLRKLLASAGVVAAALLAVPTVLAALQSPSAFAAPFEQGNVVTKGWLSPQRVDAKRLRIDVPVEKSLTIANTGSLSANYKLTARISGDRAFASRLFVVATRRQDEATLFSGPVTSLRAVDLGRFAARTRESVRLRVTLASTGSAATDNDLQGRGASVSFTWTATQA